MANDLLVAVLLIPLMLVLILATASNFSISTQSQFEGSAVSNEDLGNVTGATTTLYPAYQIKDDATATCTVKNAANGSTYTSVTNPSGTCVITENAGYNGYVTLTMNSTDTAAKGYLNYTPYSKGGYTQFGKVINQTWQGFNMAALLPFILIAMALVGIVIGLLAM